MDETKILARLVEDLRTLTLAESGSLQLRKEVTDLDMLVRETMAAFQTQANSKGVSLTADISEGLPWIDLDPGRIRQVISSIVAIALRYTPPGGTISVIYRQVDDQALLKVQDTGPGISAEDLPFVFERFYKSTDSGGMGLGLAIARHLVEVHGGKIIAESDSGQGTSISLTLPLRD